MKINRILLLTSIVLLALLLFRTCEEKDCTLNQEEVLNTYINSRHTISMNQTKDLLNNYKERFIPKIKEIQIDPGNGEVRPDYLPTEYSLIPIQKLKDYINFLEVLQEKNPNQIISGVAINFGAYNLNLNINDKSTESNLKDPKRIGDYKGRLTTVFTPTYYDKNIKSEYDAEKHIPFYIAFDDESDKFKGTFIPLSTYIDSTTNQQAAVLNKNNKNHIAQANSFPNFSLTKTTVIKENKQSVAMNEFTDMPPRKPGE